MLKAGSFVKHVYSDEEEDDVPKKAQSQTKKVHKVATNNWQKIIKDSRTKPTEGEAKTATNTKTIFEEIAPSAPAAPAAGGFFLDFGAGPTESFAPEPKAVEPVKEVKKKSIGLNKDGS